MCQYHIVTRQRNGNESLSVRLLSNLELKLLNPQQSMKRFVDFICPNSPFVWDGSGLSSCFDNLVLGFAVNAATIILVSFLGLTARDTRRYRRMSFLEKTLLHYLPVLGACLSCADVVLLLKRTLDGECIIYFVWLCTCTRFLVWVMITFFWGCARADTIFCNTIVGGLWMLRPIVGLLHLQRAFSSAEVFELVKESCTVSLDVMFGISVNFFRIKLASSKSSSMDDPLLPAEMDVEEGYLKELRSNWSFWDLLTFKPISSVIDQGVTKQLDFEDLLLLPSDMDPTACHEELFRCWQTQLSSNLSNPSLFKSIFNAYGWPYLRLGLLKVFNDCIGFGGPLLLNKLIRTIQQDTGSLDGYIIAISMGLVSVLKSFSDSQYTFHLSKLKLRLRSSIMTMIYLKCLHVSIAERSKFSEGEIQTFMSIDADRTANLCNSFHDMWSLPLQIGMALYLLYTQVKLAFLSGFAITLLLIPVNRWISKMLASATEKMMKQKDERVRRTGELWTHIRTLKMYGWEILFSSWVTDARSLEVKHLATRKYLDAWCVFFWATTPTLFSLFTFGLFTLMGHQLDAATVFTCIALFNSLISPLNSFPWVINGLIDAFISTRRLSRFLCCSEKKSVIKHMVQNNDQSDCFPGDISMVMRNACCAWSSGVGEHNLVLNQVTLEIPRGVFVVVIGEVGSGKSSMLCSILGEMQLVRGSIHLTGSTAYVPQVPWILSGTIRDNILLGRSLDSDRYSEILRACALDVDISLMAGKDMTFIGERGTNLSGGQRARLALARALYHNSDVYMLDDVLSAVDAQVGRWILHNVILGPLMEQKTCILCTHNIQAVSMAQLVVVMERGHVKWVGSSSDFAIHDCPIFYSVNEFNPSSNNQEHEDNLITSTTIKQNASTGKGFLNTSSGAEEITEVEERKEGRVEVIVYKQYASFCGWFISVVILLSAIFMQISRNGNDLWLSYWVDTSGSNLAKYSTSFYLIVLCIFCIVNSVLTLARSFSFAYGGLQAAMKVHNLLLDKLIHAPILFFDQTPSGRILNRFSSDLYTIDDSLPFILNILIANSVNLLGVAVVLTCVQVVLLVLLLPFWIIYSKLQFFYRSTSRELRRLDSVSRSPIYATFTETLDGSSTIRAFKYQDYSMARFKELVSLYQRTSYSEIAASLWLSLRLQLLAAFIISLVAIIAAAGSHGSLPISLGSPGLVGLALSYMAPVVALLGSFLTSFTETEKEMVSIERVLQYMEVPREEYCGRRSLDSDWPTEGQIEFQNVTMKYMPSLRAALNDISFTIAGGLKVGIVGRTGAGKSSILNALFRLAPTCSGEIVVDGQNIVDIPVRDLRACFAIVPQSPFLFEGTLRENLDPFQMSNDIRIWDILEKCHVKEEVEALGGLDSPLKEGGASFSVGQKQLLCLARALLKSSKVLCLDECTANVDVQTASVLQNTISRECRGTTVITIAHRISTVLNLDWVLVLDGGELVEEGKPQILLREESSMFSGFAKASAL